MLYMALTIGILILIIVLLFRSNKHKDTRIDTLENIVLKECETREVREEINRKYEKIKEDINNSTDVISDDGLPINEKPGHNHSFSEPCTESCPAYNIGK